MGTDLKVQRSAAERMAEAGTPRGPTFAGRLRSTRVDDPIRIRTRSVAIAVAMAAANGVQIGEEILADARALPARIDTELDVWERPG